MFKTLCSRCLGSGKYDRGTCFRCTGLGFTLTAKKPAPRFEVSAVFNDGVRRVMRVKSATTAEKAIKAVMTERDWFGFDLTTAKVRAL